MPITQSRHDTEYEDLLPLFERLTDVSLSESERQRVREKLVEGHLPLAEHIVARYRDRGQPMDDLRQVARVGLIGAVDRFDPNRGTDFVAFAVPTIMGEVRRYFRDSAWAIRVPRPLKELNLSISRAVAELTAETGRSPRPRQIADRLGISLEAVYEGLRVGMAYQAESLDAKSRQEDETGQATQFGVIEPSLNLVENQQALGDALAELPDREAAIVRMRFFEELTQRQIAERIGVSQVQVSRLLAKAVAHLRTAFLAEDNPSGASLLEHADRAGDHQQRGQ